MFMWWQNAGVHLLLLGVMGTVASGCKPTTEGRKSHMQERTGLVTTKGNPVTLLGNEVKVGQKAPDVELVANDLAKVRLSSLWQGKVCILSAVSSLDTRVCDMETRRFNEEAGKMGAGLVILTVSMDLPFAQRRWCGAAGVENVITLSDYQEAAFGKSYGILIKDSHLLARAVFVVDKQGTIRYIELVKEIGSEPNYGAALNAARELM
jgi:thiol peroxidase